MYPSKEPRKLAKSEAFFDLQWNFCEQPENTGRDNEPYWGAFDSRWIYAPWDPRGHEQRYPLKIKISKI